MTPRSTKTRLWPIGCGVERISRSRGTSSASFASRDSPSSITARANSRQSTFAAPLMVPLQPWGRADERTHHLTGKRVLTCDRSSYEPSTREMRIDIRYLLEGERQGTEIALFQVMWTWQQVLGALEESGLAIDLLYGDVDMAPFDEGSPRLLVSARKR